jgi:hypothetical protein
MLVAESSTAQQSINAAPDAIFHNGKIITVDSSFTIQQAFAVRGDLYVAVGSNAAIQALAGENTRLVDLRGSAVIPGLSDNHDHLYNSEKVMRGIDLVGATSTAEVLRRLRDGLAKAKAGETFFGSVGWRAPLPRMISTKSQLMSHRGVARSPGRGRHEQCRPEEGGDCQGNAVLHRPGDPEGQQRRNDWGAP